MAYGTLNVDAITSSSGDTSGGLYGFKNRIINGAMMIDQRNSGAAVAPSAGGAYDVDRWIAFASQTGKYTAQQGTTNLPAGFVNSLNCVSSGAYSVLASDYFMFTHRIEGLNVADLAWGTANAKAITLSFWAYSSLTGTFGGSIVNSAQNRSYPFSYSIPVANTPTYISVTIPGDTTGTWLTTNGIGMGVNFGLGMGSTYSGSAGSWAGATYYSATGATSVVGTNAATFYITGVQLEKGSTATSFDYRPYGTELALCQRYFWKTNSSNAGQMGCLNGTFRNTTLVDGFTQFPVTMRAAPTTSRGGTSDTFYVSGLSATAAYSGLTPTLTADMMWAEWTISGGTAAFNAAYNGQQSFSAEL